MIAGADEHVPIVSIMCQSCADHVSIMCRSCVNHVPTRCLVGGWVSAHFHVLICQSFILDFPYMETSKEERPK